MTTKTLKGLRSEVNEGALLFSYLTSAMDYNGEAISSKLHTAFRKAEKALAVVIDTIDKEVADNEA